MSSPRPSSPAQLRAELKRLGEVRASLIDRVKRARLPPDVVDRWLLAGLTAEELGLGGSGGALGSAEARDFGPVEQLVSRVEGWTRLSLGISGDVFEKLRQSTQGPLPFPAFAELRRQADPFGVLAQSLRAADAESRRDVGGYYTPYPLAREIAAKALDGFEHVPAIIDPACGGGTFLTAAFDVLFTRDPAGGIDPIRWAIAALHGVELDPIALLAARLALVTRALKAEAAARKAGQLPLFGQTVSYGAMIQDRLQLGDSLGEAPRPILTGTERLRLRLTARDVPGRLPQATEPHPIVWDTAFPLRFSDAEGAFQPGGFDVVLTNPPFVPVDRIPPELRQQLMASLTTAHKRFDLFIGFVERAFTLLRPEGRATLLIPRTFLTETNAEKCRRMLLEKATVERIEELGEIAFDDARVECIALSFRARKPGADSAVEIVRPGREPGYALQNAFTKTLRAMWRMDLARPEAAECLRLVEQSVPLGKYFCASWGARGTPVEKFHLDSGEHPLAKPMLKGEDVEPFRIRKSSRWLLYDLEQLYRPARPELFEAEKLVVRKVTGKRGLVCAVDSGHHYTDDSLACVVRKADLLAIPKEERKRHRLHVTAGAAEQSKAYDLHLVAALLQTPLVQTCYRVLIGGGLNVFPESIEALPLPPPERLDLPEAAELTSLARRASEGSELDLAVADRLARTIYGLGGSDN